MELFKIIIVDTLADAGEPDAGYLVFTSDGKLYKGNGTASPDYVYSTVSPLPFALIKTIKFANYTATDSDTVILCDGTFTVTLQTVDSYAGNDLFIKNIGSGTITVDGFSTETIDGALTKTLTQNESIFIKAIDNTTGWAILSDSGSGITRSINNIIISTTAGGTAATDYVYFCTGTLTLTLPSCIGNTNRYTVKCLSGTLTIDTTLAQTIDGSTSIGVAVEDSVDIISNNIEWKIV